MSFSSQVILTSPYTHGTCIGDAPGGAPENHRQEPRTSCKEPLYRVLSRGESNKYKQGSLEEMTDREDIDQTLDFLLADVEQMLYDIEDMKSALEGTFYTIEGMKSEIEGTREQIARG